ncbi:putative pentatricopeptide repeat-containing protein At3g15130 [Syzygium oleosum]|uniref:putative pentatricopeptide repeat-containing protein At3g15130 n=1 Tax=Syzygium oleosum TaxID=219896 RepID=UPI0011D1D126|nr:putative pentatricopeptide repeat-containing protein At3g15130 [Syzygium oleosum]XP_056167965.1 putative pentatricopeptide repeat-containing protein At3g15130 [Syzygium oleosum]
MIERQRLANLLRNCSRNRLLKQGLQVHGAITKVGFAFDVMLSNDLIDLYGKCGRVGMSRDVFDRMPQRNVVSWTALMCGYLRDGNAEASLTCFCQMRRSPVEPNEFTLSTGVKACGVAGVLDHGMQIHGLSIKTGFDTICVVGNCIIDMYAKCGRIGEAARMFNTMPSMNLISWNVMIAGHVLENNDAEKALVLFREMQEAGEVPDEYTFTSTLKACNRLGDIKRGSQIHAFLITSGFGISGRPAVAGSLVDLYVKCQNMSEARKVFDRMEDKNVISWSALILGYAREENLRHAMELFKQLEESSVQVDGFVLSSLIGVFADFALLEQGKQMHAYTIKLSCGQDISVANSILDMYLKCGLTDEAEKFFSEMPAKNVVSWTVMITGFGKHGLGEEAVSLFKEMQLEKVELDSVTYLAVLSACSHSGLIDESQKIFSSLCADRPMKRQVEHYSCMVDVLGRAGRIKEAKILIESMQMKPTVGIWQTLLSACRVHGDLETSREVGEILMKMDELNPVNYVMMSNIYLEAGYWRESQKIREEVKEKRLTKVGGCSWVEIDKKVNYFYSGDDTHPLIDSIHDTLKEMENRMKEELGYVNQVRYALHDVEDESKVESLRVHSEKLAIGLALVSGGLQRKEGVIRIFKNLRICGDCHEYIKCLSRVLNMTFMVRDANRFHKFQDGLCSCKDYW